MKPLVHQVCTLHAQIFRNMYSLLSCFAREVVDDGGCKVVNK
jgi:hypothetical protein